MTVHIGQQLGNYRLIELLGRGGFANVYLGEHVYLKTQAAIKVLHTQLTPTDLRDFLHEAQTIARLRHFHIVRILDFGVDTTENTPYLVMDLAHHGTLRQRHPRESSPPLLTIVSYVKQIASALEYAHSEKLIHRDVKPENMLLGNNDEVLLSDFGIVALAHSTSSLKTQEYSGTIHYSAPEQIQGKPRPASDQYALGIVIYEWLVGRRPFSGSSQIEIAMQHLSVSPPPLRAQHPEITLPIEQVMMRALEKNPENRFENVMAFATALEKAVNHSLVPSKLAPDLRLYIANNAVELSWSPNNNLLALVDRDKNVLIFNSSNAQQLLNSAILRENVNHYCRKILWSPCGKYLMIKTDSSNRSEGTSHYFFDLSAKRHIFTYKDVYSLSWSDNDRFLLIEQKGTYRLIDLENYHQIT